MKKFILLMAFSLLVAFSVSSVYAVGSSDNPIEYTMD